MKQTIKISTVDRIPYRGIERGHLGSHHYKKTAEKTDLVVDNNTDESDRTSTTIRSSTSNTTTSGSENSATSFSQHIVQRLVDIWRHLVLCYDVDLERRQLLKMTSEQLEDMGLDRSSVNREARRSFLDIPSQRDRRLDKRAYPAPQRSTRSYNPIRGNKAFIILSLTGALISIVFLLVFGYVIALSVAAGFAGGSLVAWLSRGLRKYPNHYIDIRETD